MGSVHGMQGNERTVAAMCFALRNKGTGDQRNESKDVCWLLEYKKWPHVQVNLVWIGMTHDSTLFFRAKSTELPELVISVLTIKNLKNQQKVKTK